MRVAAGLLAWALLAPAVPAQEHATAASAAAGDEELGKKLSNPISDLVSIPFQFNWQNGVGPDSDLQFLLNVQPVVPFHLNKCWNLIGRFIVPYLSQPVLSPGGSPVSGLSDITFSMFFSPVSESGFTWGVGPVFVLPMTTDPRLGAGKWSIGPTMVALNQSHGWTIGILANQVFSFADTGNVQRNTVSQLFLQPFLAYTHKSMTYTLQSQTTNNWEAADDQKWTVPINLIVSKLAWLGPFPLSIGGGVGYYAVHPDIGPKWRLQMSFTVLLPSKH